MNLKNLFIQSFCVVVSFSFMVFSQPLLTDASATYTYKNESFKCGLYEGTNDMPADHLADGKEIAKAMRSMSKINIVMIGHSVPQTTFNGWNWDSSVKTKYGLAANTNFVGANAPAVMAWDWINRIKSGGAQGGVAAADIHVLVVQLTWAPFGGPDSYEQNTALSKKIDSMSHDLSRLAQNAKKNFSNLKMILFEADPWQNNHEPYHAYHEWFFNRQVVLNQIKGDTKVDLSYKGDNAKTVWIGLGGYMWEAKSPSSSYYSDCCHITAAGATYYRDKWLKSLLENPVLSTWLLATVGVENTGMPFSIAPNFKTISSNKGIEVTFALPYSAQIGLGLLSTNGQVVVPMFEKTYAAGTNNVTLKAANILTPGAYIVQVNNGTSSQSHMMTIAK
jgi:hypothetical protein